MPRLLRLVLMCTFVSSIVSRVAGAEPDTDKKRLEVDGRLFVRDALVRSDTGGTWFNELEISSARLRANYKPAKGVKTSVELEFKNNRAELKDVYMRYQRGSWRVEVGRFKRPISIIALESAWRLPVVERGLVSENLPDAAGVNVPTPFSGRSEGATVRYRDKLAKTRVTVTAAVMNSKLPGNADRTNLLQDGYLRAEVRPIKWLELAVGGGYLARTNRVDGPIDHVFVSTADVFIDRRWIHAWAEVFYGRSPFFVFPQTLATGHVRAARLLVAPRLYRSKRAVRWVDVYALVNAMDLSSRASNDWAWEAGGGVAVRFDHDWRLQLQALRREAGANFVLDPAYVAYLQLGSVF